MFYVLMGLVVLCVSGLIFGATMLIRGDADQIEDRLQSLTKNGGRGVAKQSAIQGSVLKSPLDDVPNALEEFANKFLNLRKWIEQSGLKLTQSKCHRPPRLEIVAKCIWYTLYPDDSSAGRMKL